MRGVRWRTSGSSRRNSAKPHSRTTAMEMTMVNTANSTSPVRGNSSASA
jgi:hypothetical protein